MKKILIFAAALSVLAACNKDDVKEINRGKSIDFRAAMETKATEYTDAVLSEFFVTSLTDEGAVYFSDVKFMKESVSPYYFVSETAYYWPASGDLHFFAFYPAPETLGEDIVLTIDSETKTLADYTPAEDIADQQDIIIATAVGNKATNEDSGIAVEFAHQLSRVEVWVDNTNESYVYSVKGVRIANAYPSGDLDFSNGATWTEKGEKVTYEVVLDEAIANLTTSQNLLESVGGFAMLIPQNTVAWEKTADDASGDDALEGEGGNDLEGDLEEDEAGETAATDGSYMSVLVQINTVSGSRVYPPVTDDPDDEEYAWMAAPMDFNWEPGYKYEYVLHLGTGGGITDPAEDEVKEVFGGVMKFDVSTTGWIGKGQNAPM